LADSGARGGNVTVPFKFEAWQLATRRTPRAQRAEAANTLRFDAEGWWCDNTDGIGLVRDITVNAGVALAGRRVLLIGAGGAAAGVLGPLIEAGPAVLVVANRTASKAQALADRHADLARDHGVTLCAAPLDTPGTAFDVVINGTASSLAGAGVPVPASVLRPGALAVDMMYGAGARPFLDWAVRHGTTGRDGLGMLVEQAAESFFAWRGVRPETAPVLTALRAQVDGVR
jgi:shikimate dehydrogenase